MRLFKITVFVLWIGFIGGLSAPSPAWGEDLFRSRSIGVVFGTPISLGVGLEFEYYFRRAHSLALNAAGVSILASDIEDTGVIRVGRELEVDLIYRFYGGQKAPGGVYGMLGLGVYDANTTGGDLTLTAGFFGTGYKWKPTDSFSFSIQGGLAFHNSEKITQANVTYHIDSTDGFVSIRSGFNF